MKNIFENAKFSDKFRTRYGEMAIFIGRAPNYGPPNFMLIIDSYDSVDYFYEDGSFYLHTNHPCDIVSKWEEHINEEELDRLAKESYPYEDGIEEAHWNSNQDKLRDAYKAGYRKAKKE